MQGLAKGLEGYIYIKKEREYPSPLGISYILEGLVGYGN
jgi:hypothetical protein